MPGFKSHYLFGRCTLDSFTPNEYESFIVRYPQSFHIGLQGPDVFFYYLPAWLLHKHNIGNVMHNKDTKRLFLSLIEARNSLLKKDHRLIADAYICGFMAHYTLDCAMHPYIYYRTKNAEHDDKKLYDFGLHVFLETDIDNAMLRHYNHIMPTDFAMGDTIKLSVTEHMVISLLLYKAISMTYPNDKVLLYVIRHALSAMSIEANLMQDPSGIKKKCVRSLERIFVGHAVISAMIPSDTVVRYKDPCNLRHKTWYNPWDKSTERNESVYDLIDDNIPLITERIHYYSKAHTLSKHVSEDEKTSSLNKLLESLGNKSYLTGLEL